MGETTMSDATLIVLFQLLILGPLFTWMICDLFHSRSMSKLREEHREEEQRRRDEVDARREETRARNEATRGDASSLTLVNPLPLVSLNSTLAKRMEDARLKGFVEGLSESVSSLRKRVAALEDERKNNEEGAA